MAVAAVLLLCPPMLGAALLSWQYAPSWKLVSAAEGFVALALTVRSGSFTSATNSKLEDHGGDGCFVALAPTVSSGSSATAMSSKLEAQALPAPSP